MNKKRFYIVRTLLMIVMLVAFEIIMHYFVGEEVLLQKGALRTFWLTFPIIIVGLSSISDLIISKK